MNIPKLKKCDMYEICEQFNNLYKMCDDGADFAVKRCSAAEKGQMYLLFKIAKKLDALDKED